MSSPGITDVLMPKTQLLSTGAELNLGNRVLGETEKNNFISFAGKGVHSELMPLKTVCPNQGEFGEEFYSNASRVGLL